MTAPTATRAEPLLRVAEGLLLAALLPYLGAVAELLADAAPAHLYAPLCAPLLALGSLYLSRRRRPQAQPGVTARVLLSFALITAALAATAGPFWCAPALPVAILLVAHSRGGPEALRFWLAPALLFALLFPAAALAERSGLALWLQRGTADAAAALLSTTGLPAVPSGIFIDTGRFTGIVTSGCAGVNTLFGLVALGLCVAQFEGASPRRLGLLVLVACAAGLLANTLRVATLTALGHHAGHGWVEGPLHDLMGLLLFAAALALALRTLPGRRQVPTPAEAAG